MSDKKDSESENSDDFMEWEEDSGIENLEEDGPSSIDQNLESRCLNSQPSSSGYIGQKRKSDFSSPLAAKITRRIWKEEDQLAHLLVNKTTNLKKTSEVARVPQMKIFEPQASSATSDNKSVELVSEYMKSLIPNIFKSTIYSSSTAACQYGRSHSRQDLDMAKGKINRPLYTELLPTHRKEKQFTCSICHSKWDDVEALQRHLKSHVKSDD